MTESSKSGRINESSTNSRVKTVLAVFVVAAGVVILVMLGFWQLERGAEKRNIKMEYDSRINKTPLEDLSMMLDVDRFEFFRVSVTGVYIPGRQIFLDNRILNGQPGFDVITPLRITGTNMHVLVNRGWIPWGQDRNNPPQVETPEGSQHIEGVLKHPADDYYTLEETSPTIDQVIWQNLDVAQYRKITGFTLQDMIIRLSPESDAGGFVREWPGYDSKWIARHRGYAIQWFSLAFVLVIVSIATLVRRKRTVDN